MCECRDDGRAEVERWDERIWEGGNGNMGGGVRMRRGERPKLMLRWGADEFGNLGDQLCRVEDEKM